MIESLLAGLASQNLVTLRVSGAAAIGIDRLLIEMFDAVDDAKSKDQEQDEEKEA
jgi:hypothetical protein